MEPFLSALEEKYRVTERAYADIKKYGSIDRAIEFLKKELGQFESLWSAFSCDSLGHGIKCIKLKIGFLERLKNNQEVNDAVRKKTFDAEVNDVVRKKIFDAEVMELLKKKLGSTTSSDSFLQKKENNIDLKAFSNLQLRLLGR